VRLRCVHTHEFMCVHILITLNRYTNLFFHVYTASFSLSYISARASAAYIRMNSSGYTHNYIVHIYMVIPCVHMHEFRCVYLKLHCTYMHIYLSSTAYIRMNSCVYIYNYIVYVYIYIFPSAVYIGLIHVCVYKQ